MANQTASEPRRSGPSSGALSAAVTRLSVLAFLVALLMFIISVAVLEGVRYGDLVLSTLLSLVLVSGVLAVGARRSTLMLAGVVMVIGLTARWLNHFHPEIVPAALHLIAGMAFLAIVIVHFLRFILRAPYVDAQVLQTGIATYLVFGLLWSLAYMLVAQLVPGSFVFTEPGGGNASMDAFHAVYFSFVTLSTMGYGDIVPVTRVARVLAILEATTGVMYVSVLIARLVGLYSSVTALPGQSDVNGSASKPSL